MCVCIYISPLIIIITTQTFLTENWDQNRQWDPQYHINSGFCLEKSIKLQVELNRIRKHKLTKCIYLLTSEETDTLFSTSMTCLKPLTCTSISFHISSSGDPEGGEIFKSFLHSHISIFPLIHHFFN